MRTIRRHAQSLQEQSSELSLYKKEKGDGSVGEQVSNLQSKIPKMRLT